jgi:hypothetical protein
MIVPYQLQKILNEAIVTCFKVLSYQLPGVTEENENLSQESRPASSSPSEYEARGCYTAHISH